MDRRPQGFHRYWQALEEELAGVPARAVLEPLPVRSSAHFTVSTVRLTSIGPYRISGYLSVPTTPGPHPALLELPRHGSVNNPPHYNDRLRYVVLTLMHRGQRLADEPFAAAYPGLLTHGIQNPDTYVYRGIVADCLRGAEYLLGHPAVDRERVGLVGDDLAVLTAARRPGFRVLQLTGQLFHRSMEARTRTVSYPLEELNDHLRATPEAEAAVRATLELFEPLHHAPQVRATTLLSVTGGDGPGSLPWLRSLADALGGPVEPDRLTDEDGTDHDRVDAWMANQLGTTPMSRFLTEVPHAGGR